MGLKIVQLKAENFKKLEAVEIVPNDNLVMITGANGAGKSSVLDSITAALCGEREVPRVPIKKGKDKGCVKLDLGEFTVVRRFTKAGSYLSIENKEGFTMKSPQKFLDEIVGKISFDPLEWANIKDLKVKRKILCDLVSLNLDDLTAKAAPILEDRKMCGREVKAKEVNLEKMPYDAELPAQELVISEITTRLQEAMLHNDSIDKAANHIQHRKGILEGGAAKIAKVKGDIEAVKWQMEELLKTQKCLQEKLEICERDHADLTNSIAADEAALAKMEHKDITSLQGEIKHAEDKNRLIRANKEYLKARDELAAERLKYKGYTEQLEAIEKEKAARVAGIRMPVPDLEITEDDILYKGSPFDQAGDGEKLLVSLAISMALNPKLRVLRIKDGSLLDSKHMALINQMLHEKDYQLWCEVVDESGKVGIYIEEGEIKNGNGNGVAAAVVAAQESAQQPASIFE